MARFRRGMGQLACVGAFAGCLATAGAAPAPKPAQVQADGADARMLREFNTILLRAFALPKDLVLEPGLRAAADKLAAQHLDRMKAQLQVWIREERSAQQREGGQARPGEVFYPVGARLLNELAHWHLEPGDADYEKATLEAIKASPQVCNSSEIYGFIDFSSRILRIQAMPPAQQQAALATESRLLERWGKPRQPAAPWPTPLPQEAAMEAVERLRAGGPRPALALPPVIAWQLLSERIAYDKMPVQYRCVFQRWWLLENLAKGQPAAAVLNAFRYGTMVTATSRFGDFFDSPEDKQAEAPPTGAPVFPSVAQRFEAVGSISVAREFDASGKTVRASVVERKITVPGIRGVRPIAFEDAFDAVSVQHVLKLRAPDTSKPAPEKVFQMVWSLEPEAPANATNKPVQGKK